MSRACRRLAQELAGLKAQVLHCGENQVARRAPHAIVSLLLPLLRCFRRRIPAGPGLTSGHYLYPTNLEIQFLND